MHIEYVNFISQVKEKLLMIKKKKQASSESSKQAASSFACLLYFRCSAGSESASTAGAKREFHTEKASLKLKKL